MKLSPSDEYLHVPPPGSDALWSDNFWFSVCDRDADVFGINHIHASLSHGYLRASAYYVIDGVPVQWASRQPLGDELAVFDTLGRRPGVGTRGAGALRALPLAASTAPSFGFDLGYICGSLRPLRLRRLPRRQPARHLRELRRPLRAGPRLRRGELRGLRGGPRAGERREIQLLGAPRPLLDAPVRAGLRALGCPAGAAPPRPSPGATSGRRCNCRGATSTPSAG